MSCSWYASIRRAIAPSARCEVALERFAAAGGGVLGPQRGESAVDLGAHERGVLEQPSDLAPDEPVELVGADRAALADAPADVPLAVLADAPVVVDPLVRGSGARAVAGVAALAADEHALQQRRLLGVAPGEARVLDQARLRELEGLLGDDRRRPGSTSTARPAGRRVSAGGRGARRARGSCASACRAARRSSSSRTRPARGRRGCAASPTPSSGPTPSCRSGCGRRVGQPPSELADRDALLHVAAEDFADDLRLGLVDLPVPLTYARSS